MAEQQPNFLELVKDWSIHNWNSFQSWMKEHPRGALALKFVGGTIAALILFVVLLFLLVRVGAFGALPSEKAIKNIQNRIASEVYSQDGVLLGKYFIENRTNVSYDALSPYLVDALVATEDARFFEHQGVDLRALTRVFFKTVLMQDLSSGGGSTLSQQLAKNVFKRRQYKILSTPVNKIKEMYIARRLERYYSKEELLNLYLNTVPFGGDVYGINVAAKQFFGTTPSDVSMEEAAMLIGMLKGNTLYNPKRNPERALERRNTVLHQMYKYEYLDKPMLDSLVQIPLQLNYQRESSNEGIATYFRAHIRQIVDKKLAEYNQENDTHYNLYTDGLKIYTTIDSRMQKYGEEAVQEHLSRLQKDFDTHWKDGKPWGSDAVIEKEKRNSKRYKSLKASGFSENKINEVFKKKVKMTVFDWEKGQIEKEWSPMDSIKYYFTLLNVGFLAAEPETGAVRSWVGGINHKYFQYDHVKSKRQVGSTFKPIVYTTALEQGYHPCEYTDNHLIIYSEYDDWKPENADNKYEGVYSMEGALSKSVNSVTVQTIMNTSVDSVIQTAQQMGIRSDIPQAPAIALGAADASLYDMVNVYGTLANKGVRPEMHYLSRIEDYDGNVLFEVETDTSTWEQVIAEDNALMMTDMLQSVVDSGTARRLRYQYHLESAIAGKTGTTQNQSDGWFIGYTPHLVAGVWVGAESPKVRFRTLSLGSGSNMALPIWGRFMNKVYKDKEFAYQRNALFPSLPDSLAQIMDCAPYLEHRPIFVDQEIDDIFWESDDEHPYTPIEEVIEQLFKKDKKRVNIPPSDRSRSEAQREESERIRKNNQRLEEKRKRKEKRKKTLKRIFGG